MKTFKIPFAYTDNKEVIDISAAKKGIIYKCNCGADVKLRGGQIISNHFYHINDSECSLESSIHKAYKDVFLKIKVIRLPHLIDGKDKLKFEKIELEKKIDDYIPDAIGYIGGDKYIIEFAKSSYIGERKEKKIKKSNLFCIEVDIIKTITSIKEIENHLINDKGYKHIIHIPNYKPMEELREEFTTAYYKLKCSLESSIEENKRLKEENKRLKEIVKTVPKPVRPMPWSRTLPAGEYIDAGEYIQRRIKALKQQ